MLDTISVAPYTRYFSPFVKIIKVQSTVLHMQRETQLVVRNIVYCIACAYCAGWVLNSAQANYTTNIHSMVTYSIYILHLTKSKRYTHRVPQRE